MAIGTNGQPSKKDLIAKITKLQEVMQLKDKQLMALYNLIKTLKADVEVLKADKSSIIIPKGVTLNG